MMIWDFIRDFFVQFIFGGYDSTGEAYSGFIGSGSGEFNTMTMYVSLGEYPDNPGDIMYIPVGDWLSTTATIICMCLIIFLLICLVRWIFRAVSSAMLLK